MVRFSGSRIPLSNMGWAGLMSCLAASHQGHAETSWLDFIKTPAGCRSGGTRASRDRSPHGHALPLSPGRAGRARARPPADFCPPPSAGAENADGSELRHVPKHSTWDSGPRRIRLGEHIHAGPRAGPNLHRNQDCPTADHGRTPATSP